VWESENNKDYKLLRIFKRNEFEVTEGQIPAYFNLFYGIKVT
jgi:hypothetical protein